MRKIINISLLIISAAVCGFAVSGQISDDALVRTGFAVLFGAVAFFTLRFHFFKIAIHEAVFILAFMLCIMLPFLGEKEDTSLENRKLAPFPEWRWSNIWKFFFQYQVYFEDQFAYRNDMVESINKIKIKLFNKSAIPHQVSIGRDGWLYMNRTDYIAATSEPYTTQELDSIVKNLELMSIYFKSKNIKFYFIMLPLKERIYPEYLPELQKVQMKVSRRDQIYERLNKNSIITSIDCKQELIDGKKRRLTYYKTDTHWNLFGAYLGYQKLIKSISKDFPVIKPHGYEKFKVDAFMEYDGDLQKMMGFTDVFQLERVRFRLIDAPEYVTADKKVPEYPNVFFSTTTMKKPVNGLKMFLVRDSFSEHLKEYLIYHFDSSELAWVTVPPITEIMNTQPDLVIYEMHEIFANYLLNFPPEISQDTAFVNYYKKNYMK